MRTLVQTGGMAVIINATFALAARNQHYLQRNQNGLARSIERVASGGLNARMQTGQARMLSAAARSKMRTLEQSEAQMELRLARMGIAEQALGDMQGIVHEMRSVALQALNGTNGEDELRILQTQFDELQKQLASLGGSSYLSGQNGVNMDQAFYQAHQLQGLTTSSDNTGLPMLATNASAAISALDDLSAAIMRSTTLIGAHQNGLERAIDRIGRDMVTVAGEESRAADVGNIAEESIALAKYKLLVQVGIAMQQKLMDQAEQAVYLLQALAPSSVSDTA